MTDHNREVKSRILDNIREELEHTKIAGSEYKKEPDAGTYTKGPPDSRYTKDDKYRKV